MHELPPGVYETLKTVGLLRALEASPLVREFARVDPADVPGVFARHVSTLVRRALEEIREEPERIALLNELVSVLLKNSEPDLDGHISQDASQLLSLRPGDSPEDRSIAARSTEEPSTGEPSTGEPSTEGRSTAGRSLRGGGFARPATPLSDVALLTNGPDEPTLGAELRSELASADRVDLLCAFVRWHGLRVIEDALADLRDRSIPLRVITTTYLGATERRALDELVRRFGAQVRISYETQSTRLHAKAWLLRRESGFDTAFVGSSNLSKAALVDGLEWNVRLSAVATPDLIHKFSATFNTYWADAAFAPYDPDTDAERLDEALRRAGGSPSEPSSISLAGLEIRPFPHQEQILEALDTERQVHDRHRNLVVAATGTGKTVVAALDYRRLATDVARRPSLLFIAHRKEILDQSLRVYREVLADGAFGEPFVGGSRPQQWRHVFASIQSLSSSGVDQLAPEEFDVVVVDEFHHAEAATYRRVLDRLRPRELLGLTATPERADGVDVRDFFDGRTAYELRLWDALADDLLVPFHYFGIADDVDLTSVTWKRGAYDVAGLNTLYTGNDARAAKVLRAVRDKVTDVRQMRALGFCVSVDHAEYMARVFREAGIPARAVSGRSTAPERDQALRALRLREINVLFAVDLFNEGLDLPAIDTVLFLRPTQSATVFLQQLGRGLRRSPEKAVLTALDFIGQHRQEFRFDVRYRALTGISRRQLADQIEKGFPFLPSGSQLILDRVAQQIVLENVRHQLRTNRAGLVAELRSHGDVRLTEFLFRSGRDMPDIYRSSGTWTDLRRAAALPTRAGGAGEKALLGRVKSLLHVDDPERAETYDMLLSPDAAHYSELTDRQQRLARMLFFTLWPDKGGFSSYSDGLGSLREHPAATAEMREVVQIALDSARHAPLPLGDGLLDIPLFSHARYRREEILAALGWATLRRVPRTHVSGVAWASESLTDALLINLHKSEATFSPTTMYRDYAISPDLFHWESQNATSLTSETGQRYVHHRERRTRVVLFVRDGPKDDLGTAPFLCLGQASCVEHRGERPISITWRLSRRMPGDLFHTASVVAR